MTAHQDAQDANLTASPAGVASVPTVDAAAVLRDHQRFNATPPEDGVKGCPPEFACMECGQPWRGYPATGGCEAVLLARRVALLEGLLREHEWEGYVGGVAACTACGRAKRDRHAPGCPLGAALADGG